MYKHTHTRKRTCPSDNPKNCVCFSWHPHTCKDCGVTAQYEVESQRVAAADASRNPMTWHDKNLDKLTRIAASVVSGTPLVGFGPKLMSLLFATLPRRTRIKIPAICHGPPEVAAAPEALEPTPMRENHDKLTRIAASLVSNWKETTGKSMQQPGNSFKHAEMQ